MNIPAAIVWEVVILLLGFILGTLWGHHDKIGQRVTHHQCQNNRNSCPCIADITKIQETIDDLHPHKKD